MPNFYNIKWIRTIRRSLRGYVPFSNWWILWRKIDRDAKSILDLGCGTGAPMRFINRHQQFYTVGVDGYLSSLEQCRKVESHHVLLHGDIRRTIYKDKTFDIVIALQVLEHLDRQDGEALLENMERTARKQVIVSTDINEFVQGVMDNNELQIHRCIWTVDELRERGFEIHGLSFRGFGGDTGCTRVLPALPRWLISIILQLVAGPFVYHYPQYAGAIVCVKNLAGESNEE